MALEPPIAHSFRSLLRTSTRDISPQPTHSAFVSKLIEDEHRYLVRTQKSELDGHEWYSFILSSPSGKVVEICTTQIQEKLLSKMNVSSFHAHGECGANHISTTYSKKQLDYFYNETNGT